MLVGLGWGVHFVQVWCGVWGYVFVGLFVVVVGVGVVVVVVVVFFVVVGVVVVGVVVGVGAVVVVVVGLCKNGVGVVRL